MLLPLKRLGAKMNISRLHTRRWILATGLALALVTAERSLGQPSPTPTPLQLMRFHAPNLGASDAKVNIVEFLDPACEGCRAFHPVVKQVLADHPGKVRLWVRYAPFHKGADFAVKALEGARLQGRYWEALDALFAKQREWTRHHAAQPDQVIKALDGLGLDMARLQRDIASPELARIVDLDMADVKALKLLQTPTFFVNGKPLKEYTFDQLRAAVMEEVRLHYPK